jgi:hypothetical protein
MFLVGSVVHHHLSNASYSTSEWIQHAIEADRTKWCLLEGIRKSLEIFFAPILLPLGLLVLVALAVLYRYRTRKTEKKPQKDPLFLSPINMSVVGIDFGNLNTIVAVARNRGMLLLIKELM